MSTFLDFIPILVFFIAYKYAGIIAASAAILATTLIVLPIQLMTHKQISWSTFIATAMLLLFAGLTVYSGNPIFIKMKPTIVYTIFSLILLSGLAFNKVLLQKLFNQGSLRVSDHGWRLATFLWIGFFLTAAIVNELVWRNYEESVWVTFKVFGMLPVTFLCAIANAFIFYRHAQVD